MAEFQPRWGKNFLLEPSQTGVPEVPKAPVSAVGGCEKSTESAKSPPETSPGVEHLLSRLRAGSL
jgi:hypothetical protein